MPSHQLFASPSPSFALLLIFFNTDFFVPHQPLYHTICRCLECIALLPRVVLVVLLSARAVAPPLPRVQKASPTGAPASRPRSALAARACLAAACPRAPRPCRTRCAWRVFLLAALWRVSRAPARLHASAWSSLPPASAKCAHPTAAQAQALRAA